MFDDEKQRKFNESLRQLDNSPISKVDDFQRPLTKQTTVNKTIDNSPQKIKSGADFMADQIIRDSEREAKMAALGKIGDTIDYSKFKKGARKMMGAVPLLGAGYAALSGEPAMAAEELAGDVPVLGQAYEAIKPTESGNPEEERMMLAESQALKDYANSPAAKARRLALQGIK
jgi:hypothetical protein